MKTLLQRLNKHLRLIEERKTIPESFYEELNFQCNRVIIFGAILSFPWLAYIPVDLKLNPDEPFIIALRLGLPLFGIFLFISRIFPRLINQSVGILTLYMAYLEIATALITALAGPATVYTGGYLFIISILAYIPIKREDSYKILGASISVFFIVSILKGANYNSPEARYVFNDLISITLIAGIFIYILDSIRYLSWYRGKRIEQDQLIIQEQKDQLSYQIALAGEIQMALLPHDMPVIKECDLAYRYVPVLDVGGDFVDMLYLPDKKLLGLFVCDVSGHGVAAAFISSMVKMALNRWVDSIYNPAQTLKNIHQAIYGKIGENFVTACCCTIDLDNGKLISANAGHHPMILSKKNGQVERINTKGKLIVDFLPTDYEESVIDMERGDKLVLYTDGITETFSPEQKMLGEGKLCDLVGLYHEMTSDMMCKKIIQYVRDFSQKDFIDDDMSILVVGYL